MKIEFWSAYRHLLSLLTMVFLLACFGAANAVTPMISMGDDHTLALRSDGTVFAWGSDEYGKLGVGRALFSSVPIPVPGLSSVVTIGSGSNHTLAVKQDGTVWAWGSNGQGQLGDSTLTDRTSPTQVRGMTNVMAVAGGAYHSIALRQDGTVWGWGQNVCGELGVSPTDENWYLAKVQTLGLTGITSIAVGSMFNIALRNDGTVWAWGCNDFGQLGDGTTAERYLPVQVSGLSDIVAVGASSGSGAALRRDGSIWEWGYGGAIGNRLTPKQTSGVTGAMSLGAGGAVVAAIRSDGTMWQWYVGQSPAARLEGVSGLIKVAVGGAHTLLLKSDRTVLSFGTLNYSGQLGDGTTFPRDTPVPVVGLSKVVALVAGENHSVALSETGEVYSWGSDSKGQLGQSAAMNLAIPTQVRGLEDVIYLSAGRFHNLAVKQDGTVWSWGWNFNGQLGDGTNTDRSSPVAVGPIVNIRKVSSGGGHSLALKKDGTVWAWGGNNYGAIGNGSQFNQQKVPIQVPGMTGVIAIAADMHSLAVKEDGSIWAWGLNESGQLGDGTTTVRLIPGVVPGLGGVVSVAAGLAHTLALKADGSVWSMGMNWSGQLGDGTTSPHLSPVAVPGLSGVVAVAAGGRHSAALMSNGKVKGWGWNVYGQLGDGTTTERHSPVEVLNLTGVTAVTAGGNYSGALKSDGTVLSWGGNNRGQLGDGTFAGHLSRVLVINASADAFLNLHNGTIVGIPAELRVPFFTIASGGIADTSATVSTTTKFNPADQGKGGSVFVTAMVPMGSLGAATIGNSPANRVFAATPPQATTASACPAPTNPLSLVQLTPTGWQTVVNGQLLPYASGVLGDQLAAQTILNGADTTNLKGAEFCVGYGTSAEDMVNNGNIRAVATIPGATTTSTCVIGSTISVGLNVTPGWNLLGNPINQSIAVSAKFGDANKVSSVWKWDTVKANWQFYAPGMDAASLESYVTSHGYGVLTEISPGDGYWVQAKVQADLGSMCGTSINLRQSSLSSGWNLVSTASPISAKEFNLTLSTTPPTSGQVPINMTSLWAWDANQSNWYFYAPVLDAQGGSVLTEYISRSNYKDFTSNGKTLGNGVGIWVNRP
jgi:alpha-tubulin suppressor-like RCC1 family protein